MLVVTIAGLGPMEHEGVEVDVDESLEDAVDEDSIFRNWCLVQGVTCITVLIFIFDARHMGPVCVTAATPTLLKKGRNWILM